MYARIAPRMIRAFASYRPTPAVLESPPVAGWIGGHDRPTLMTCMPTRHRAIVPSGKVVSITLGKFDDLAEG